MKLRFYSTLLFLFISHFLFGTTYYFSISGSDTNNGLTELTPFKTIVKVNAIIANLVPGDQVLFRRGDVFRGQININKSGTAESKITFGAYGIGEKPIISGAKIIDSSNWTLSGPSNWQVGHRDTIAYLFVNSSLRTLARHPDSGYLNINFTNEAKQGSAK